MIHDTWHVNTRRLSPQNALNLAILHAETPTLSRGMFACDVEHTGMKTILVIHLNDNQTSETVRFSIRSCRSSALVAAAIPTVPRQSLLTYDGRGMRLVLKDYLRGSSSVRLKLSIQPACSYQLLPKQHTSSMVAHPRRSGGGGVILPIALGAGIFAHKRVLMVPGVNHTGLAQHRGAAPIMCAMPIRLFTSDCRICPASADRSRSIRLPHVP